VQNPHRWGQPETLYKIVSPLMWRTAKADVLDQIGIPRQTEHIHWINFSPVEEHFYRSQHVTCANTVLNRISQLPDLDEKLHMLHRGQWFGLTTPLLSLRQACCHPQAVKGQFVSLNKTTLTMEELLKSLIKKAKLECEESFRQVIAALNGMFS
jgi:E3 ubiquitin-protein ligase SHPRH